MMTRFGTRSVRLCLEGGRASRQFVTRNAPNSIGSEACSSRCQYGQLWVPGP